MGKGMRRMLSVSWLPGAVLGCVLAVAAAGQTVRDTEPEAESTVAPLRARITDSVGALAPGDLDDLNSTLRELDENWHLHIAIVLVKSALPQSIGELAAAKAAACDALGGMNPCVAIVATTGDGRVVIAPGHGAEPLLRRWKAPDIANDVIAPQIRAGRVYDGLDAGLSRIKGAELQAIELLDSPFFNPWFYGLGLAGIALGIPLRLALWRHGFWCGTLGVAGGGGLLAVAQFRLHDIVLGIPGFVLFAGIAMGYGWFLLYLAFNFLLSAVLEGTGGGGSGSGLSGGGGGFGGGGASGSW